MFGPITITHIWYFFGAYLFINLVWLVDNLVNWWYRRRNPL